MAIRRKKTPAKKTPAKKTPAKKTPAKKTPAKKTPAKKTPAKVSASSPVKSWSFSRYSDYKQCPLKFKLKHIERIKEPPNKAMARGAEIHDKAEHYIKGISKRIPKELEAFKPEFKQLRRLYANRDQKPPFGAPPELIVEDTWAFTKDWSKTKWDDWIHCFLRVKLDCAITIDNTEMEVRDWKTGKFRSENNEQYTEQLELYALAALVLYPEITVVRPKLYYLDTGDVFPSDDDDALRFTQDDVPSLKKIWAKRTRAMFNDRSFAPRPNNFCRWCFFRNDNAEHGGGQCQY